MKSLLYERSMNFHWPLVKRTLSCLSLIVILMISVSCGMSSDMTPEDAKELPSANYGYANSSFLYFYYPEDKKIYYISGNAVHKMYVNGANSTLIKSALWKNPRKNPSSLSSYPFIYVSNGTVYYNDRRRDNATYKMKTDGTEHAVEAIGKTGPMGVYKARNKAVLYFDGRQQYLKENTRYFSKDSFDNLSKQTPAAGGSITALTNMQADNFVFAPEGIYFRLRVAASGFGIYGIAKVGYDASPDGTGAAARLKNTDMHNVVDPGTNITHRASEPTTWVSLSGSGTSSRINSYQFNTLNVSKDFIAYIGRSIDDTSSLLPGGLNVVSRNADRYGTPRTVRAGLRKFDLAGGGVNIIGDYLYWITDDRDNQQYKLHRVKKDGQGYAVVKNIPY